MADTTSEQERKKNEERQKNQEAYDIACANRDKYEEYYENAIKIIFYLKTAENGFNFMNMTQKDKVAKQVETAIYPIGNILEKLGLQNGEEYVNELDPIITTLITKQSEYKEKYESYKSEATSLWWKI